MFEGLALIIGISAYEREHLRLPKAVANDAGDLAELLAQHGYRVSNIRTLIDPEATGHRVRDELRRLQEAARSSPDATVLVLFSGHGDAAPDGTGTFCPVGYDPDRPDSTGISERELTDALDAIPAARMLLMLDTCHAELLARLKAADQEKRSSLPKGIYERLAKGNRAIIYASLAHQAALVNEGARNSLFTAALLSGLQHEIPTKGDLIDLFDLFSHLRNTASAGRWAQTPMMASKVSGDFPIARRGASQTGFDPHWRRDALTAFGNLGQVARAILAKPPGENAEAAVEFALQFDLSPHVRHLGLLAAAALEHGTACLLLGKDAAGRSGKVLPSPAKAELWWKEGARLKDHMSRVELWRMLKDRSGRAGEALHYLRESAEEGFPFARYLFAGTQVTSKDRATRAEGHRGLLALYDDPKTEPALRLEIKAMLDMLGSPDGTYP